MLSRIAAPVLVCPHDKEWSLPMNRSPTLPTLKDVLDAIERLEPGTRKRDLKSAVSSFCKAVGKSPEHLLAHPKEIRPLREGIAPLAIGISERRWANICSGLAKSLELVRDLMPSRNTAPIHPDWQSKLDLLPVSLSRGLSAATRWLSSSGVTPSTVTAEDLKAYTEAIFEGRMRAHAEKASDRVIWCWQRAVRTCPEWPGIALERQSKRDSYSYPFEYFPASFAADVAAYLNRLSQGALLDEDDDSDDFGPVKPVRPATIKTRRHQMRAAASCLVRSGIAPETITSIGVLVEVQNVKRILNFLLERRGGQPSGGVAQMASFLTKVALYWVKVDPTDHLRLKRIAARVAVQDHGMTAKNRERLRPFDDHQVVAEFVCLPDTIRKHVERSKAPDKRRALLAQSAAAIALQLVVPLRKGNLAALDIDTHFVSNRNGVYLVIPEAEVKNREAVNFQIPNFALDVIRWYISEYRPYLLDGPSSALFPGRNGSCKSSATLGAQICTAIKTFTGLDFNPHLFRHVAGKIFLDANPGNYEVVRQLLRHRSISTTTSSYSGAETRRAGLLHANLIEDLRKAHRPSLKRRRA